MNNAHELFQRRHLPGNETADPEWELTGELHRTLSGAKPVYRERLPNIVLQPILGPDQEPIWERHPTTGQPLYIKNQAVQDPNDPWIVREFVLESPGNGMTYKNFDFATSEEELARQVAAEKLKPESLMETIRAMADRIAQLEAGGAVEEPATVELPELETKAEDESSSDEEPTLD